MIYQSIRVIVLALGLHMSLMEVDGLCRGEDGWLTAGDSCLFFGFGSESTTFDEALATCRTMVKDSYLASCLSEKEVSYIKKYTNRWAPTDRLFIGNTLQNDENNVTNADGTALEANMEYEYKEFPGSKWARCIIWTNGKMQNFDCLHPANYICKFGPTNCGPKYTCPKGWYRDVKRCYRTVFQAATFTDAASHCHSLNATFPEPSSDTDWEMTFRNLFIANGKWDAFYMYYPRDITIGKVKDGRWESSNSLLLVGNPGWCDGNGTPENATGIVFARVSFNVRTCYHICKDCSDQKKEYMCTKDVTEVTN